MQTACCLHWSSTLTSENMSNGDTSLSGKLLAKNAKVRVRPLAAQRSFYIPMEDAKFRGRYWFSHHSEDRVLHDSHPGFPPCHLPRFRICCNSEDHHGHLTRCVPLITSY
ncbi:hypothetical protein COCC4DRAFT_130697 [Bipolaris maydis ATCC 48331]|uniref:Uncharacterized protein n=2 Tax=Cochliobolus heterostrophus TaxID=5016 RepID=M2T4Z7_COCH5|nr:uncharacterized protein COCC4DRAFT_130697 [Bipolaris maydis ATCC 48331]EMD92650.1 hypothetical protein COCHEDRAFT_1100141 [Bipolaris maydis C5]ENI08346.1 hypothetical protein COCC4DRAFT_130697 [Bipolaris maydis ATCC 48331]